MRIGHVYVLAAFALCGVNPALAQDTARNTARSAVIQQFINEGAQVQDRADGTLITPASSISRPEDVGSRAHTNTKIFVPIAGFSPQAVNPLNAPPFAGYFYETPSSLACVYKLVAVASGCNPNTFHTNATGGSKAVAIVDAYHAPNVRTDLNAYSTQFGLPATTTANFVIWYCNSTSCNQTTPPAGNTGWAQEITLDVEMVHALAPSAKIFLVEAKTNAYADLYVAVNKASALVAAAGGGQVSMSWGGPEFSGESAGDSHFATSKVVYFSSSGDSPGTLWPSVSSKVVSVGGTSVSRNPVTGAFIGESAWWDAGGGPSKYILRPAYQPASLGSKRASPDVSAVANPSTGVWVRYVGAWYIFGGTSVASPVMAAIVNNSGQFKLTTAAELTMVYAGLGDATKWFDVKQGICGPYTGYWAKAGYDYCGGVGAPRGKLGK